MHSNLTTSVILVLSAQILAPLRAQTTTSAIGNTVTYHDIARSESATQPAPPLREIAAELSGTVIGQMPNILIQFVLTLQNNGPEEVQILDRLEKFSQQLITSTKKLIPLPRRVPKDLPMVALPKGTPDRKNRDAPYPAPVQFRQITTNTCVSYEKKGNRKNPSRWKGTDCLRQRAGHYGEPYRSASKRSGGKREILQSESTRGLAQRLAAAGRRRSLANFELAGLESPLVVIGDAKTACARLKCAKRLGVAFTACFLQPVSSLSLVRLSL